MKKLITLALSVGLAAIVGLGGPFNTQSFINGTAVNIPLPGSASTTTFGITTSVSYTNDLGQLVTAGTNAAGITYGAWARPVSVRSDALGNVCTNYTISVLTSASGPTNTFTITLQRSWNGSNFDTNTTWSFTTPADLNAAGVVMMTNVPAWFLTGASHLQVSSLVYGTNSAPGSTNQITALRLNGFAP